MRNGRTGSRAVRDDQVTERPAPECAYTASGHRRDSDRHASFARLAISAVAFVVGGTIHETDIPQGRRSNDAPIRRGPVLGLDFHFDREAAKDAPLHLVPHVRPVLRYVGAKP